MANNLSIISSNQRDKINPTDFVVSFLKFIFKEIKKLFYKI